MIEFDKKRDLKHIVNEAKFYKDVFKTVCVADNGMIVGKPICEIGKHFITANDSKGFLNYKPEGSYLLSDVASFYKCLNLKGIKKYLTDLYINNNTLYLGNSYPTSTNIHTVESGDIGEKTDVVLTMATIRDNLEDAYLSDLETFQSILANIEEEIEVPDEIVRQIYLNEHYVVVPTPIEPVRISKGLLPTIKYNKTTQSKLYTYALPASNDFMFRAIFRIVTGEFTSWHVYMVIRKE